MEHQEIGKVKQSFKLVPFGAEYLYLIPLDLGNGCFASGCLINLS